MRPKTKKGKSTDHDQNSISSEGGQDTLACQSSGHSSLAFSRKCPEVEIWSVSLSQNDAKMRKSTNDDPNFISSEMVRIHQHVKFQAIQSDCNKNSHLC